MSRELKFRAWDGTGMHSNVCPWQWDFVISRAWHRCEKNTGNGILGSGGGTAEMLVPAIRFTHIMEFTGKNDKDGIEVYEDDIIEFDKEEWGGEGNIHVVSWDDDNACWDFGGGSPSDMEFRKVIGNIHQRPNLIP